MTLEKTYNSESDIPRQYRHLYKESGGKYSLLDGSKIKTETDVKNALLIDQTVRAAAETQGVYKLAHDDVSLHGAMELEVIDGKVVEKDSFAPVDVWLADHKTTRPYWFEPKDEQKPTLVKRNPWSLEHWNVTQQGRIIRDNPTQAERLAVAVGTTPHGYKPVKAGQ